MWRTSRIVKLSSPEVPVKGDLSVSGVQMKTLYGSSDTLKCLGLMSGGKAGCDA